MNALIRIPANGNPSPAFANLEELARGVADRVFATASELDQDGAFPADGVQWLDDAGLLAAPLARDLGGSELTNEQLFVLLRTVGYGSLPLG